MTKRVSCIPCAKRKVRCNRQEPCAHCKRRKIEDCIYPDESPAARIKYLEALVRHLGHDPDGDTASQAVVTPSNTFATPTLSQRGKHSFQDSYQSRALPTSGPMLGEDDEGETYLESSNFHSWDRSDSRLYTQSKRVQNYFMTEFGVSALQNIIKSGDDIDFVNRHPNMHHANILWDTYHRNVGPLCKIAFKWELEQLHQRVLSRASLKELTSEEFGLVFAIYMHSIITLSEHECVRLLSQSRQSLLSEYQLLCENAFAKANFLGHADVVMIQACTLYISASIDRIRTRSLWSFIGIVLRHAERLGFHREGTILNLSPFETERRRRIWWQLQHFDMALAIRSGSLSLLLMADWDVRLPLNIEDDDIGHSSIDFPKERSGLTDMSFCLWTFYLLDKQREFRRADGSRIGSSWMADRSVSPEQRGEFINALEKGVEDKFLRHCDPVNPLHLLLSITGRSFTANMRRLVSHADALTHNASDTSDTREKRTLDQCLRCLEYDILLHSQKSLEKFRWRLRGFFPWHALVYVITDASRRVASPEADIIWGTVGRLFSLNPELSYLSDDRRKPRAAEMVLAAWTSFENSSIERGMDRPRRPDFLGDLEKLLVEGGTHHESETVPSEVRNLPHPVSQGDMQNSETGAEPGFGDGSMNVNYNIVNNFLNLDASEIDWSFWSQWE